MVFFVATFFVRTLLAELCPAPCLDAVEAFTPVEAFLTAFLVGLPADFVGRLEVVLPAPFEAVLLAFWVAFLVAVLRAPALLAVFLAALLEGVEVEREPARAFAVCGEPLFEGWREESATGKPLMLVNVRTSMVKIFSFSNFFVLFLFCSQECDFFHATLIQPRRVCSLILAIWSRTSAILIAAMGMMAMFSSKPVKNPAKFMLIWVMMEKSML